MSGPPSTEAPQAYQAPPARETPDGPLRIVASPAARGVRVDRFLAEAIGTLSRARVKSLIEAGQARRDGTVLHAPAEPVRPGAVYTLTVPPPLPARPLPQAIPLTILYEDEALIVLDKPAGLVVHPAPGNADGTLVNALLAHCGESLSGIGGERRPGIVHRLDKDTSGVMVVAKTQEAMAALTARFAARDLDRAYLALAWGVAAPPAGRDRGGDRARSARSQADGGAPPGRQAGADPLHHAARLAWRGFAAGMPAGHRADASNPRSPGRQRPPRGRRSALFAPRAGCGTACAGAARGRSCWRSRARRCTPRGWGFATRSAARK